MPLTQRLLLTKAKVLTGDLDEVRRRLGVDETQLRQWMTDGADMPEEARIRTYELILEEQQRWIAALTDRLGRRPA